MRGWFTWPWRIVSFLVWYSREFVVANIRVIADVLSPTHRMKMQPAIVAVPAAARSNGEWMLISTLITLTPGTLTITLSRRHRLLYVHGMFAPAREPLVAEIQEMEDRLLRAMRRLPGDLSRPSTRPVPRPEPIEGVGAMSEEPSNDNVEPRGENS